MRTTPSYCGALAILLAATSCAHVAPSSAPVVAVEEPTPEQIADGVAPMEYHGIPGVFFTFEAWRNVQIRVRLQQKDLEVALAGETATREAAEAEAAALRKSQESIRWRATWGLPLGMGIGAGAVSILAIIFGAVFGQRLGGVTP